MPDELRGPLERVAADGARRARTSAAAVRSRAARIRRRRAAAAGLGSAVAVAALVGGIAVAADPGTAPRTVATGPPNAAPAATGTNRAPCQRPAPAGDVDGDCRPDRVSLLGDTVVVQGTLVGRLTAPVQHADPMRVAAVFDVDGDGYARQFQAPLGATVTHSDDLSCDQAGSLFLLPGTTTDGITYLGSELIYR